MPTQIDTQSCIAGDLRLKAEFEAIRRKILSSPRETQPLQTEVREMREKMRSALYR